MTQVKILVAGSAGFCSGVRHAVDAAVEAAKSGKVFTWGPLVHNEAVIEYLAGHGVEVVDSPANCAGGKLLIRTHGVTPSALKEASDLGLELIDTTCPRVRRLQQLAAELSGEGITLVVYGNPRHPEMRGVAGWAGDNMEFVQSAEDLQRLPLSAPAAFLAQTTGDREVYEQLKEIFLDRVPAGKVYDTLCPETGLRQEEAARLAREVELVIVVGGADSANTGTMVEICRKLKPTCRVAGAGELSSSILRGKKTIGVAAGASTPHWTIKEVVERMENEQEKLVAENEEQFAYDDEVRVVQVGEQVTGRVVRALDEEVFIDVGYKTEAVLPVAEVYLEEGEVLSERFTPETEIEITVIDVDEQEGKVVVSHKRLAREKRWKQMEQALNDETAEEGTVKQVVPAGLVLDLGAGIEGFMPGSLVDIRYVPDFKNLLGEKLQFKVIELNREKEKVILSRKKVLEEEASQKREQTLQLLEVGSVVPGVVRRLTDFGAFVDIGGIDGLVHISEISWERVEHPQSILKVGQEIEVKVLDVIPEKDRISLSYRQTQPDPWTRAMEEFSNGQIVQGKVTRLVNFGAFVEIKPGVEGLVHISQIADYHVNHPSEVIREGDQVEVKILELKPKAKRISLSIKEAGGINAPGSAVQEGAENGGVTLGDVFGELFDQEESPAKEDSGDDASGDVENKGQEEKETAAGGEELPEAGGEGEPGDGENRG